VDKGRTTIPLQIRL